jgi:hypothetical protein
VKQVSKDSWGEDSRRARIIRYLRKLMQGVHIPRRWMPRREHRLHVHLAQGFVYGVGSGAVTLLMLWIENRF